MTDPLDVKWFQAVVTDANGQSSPDLRPGAVGHAGIINLDIPPGKGAQASKLRKSLRSQLADIAEFYPLTPEEMAPLDPAPEASPDSE